MTDTDIDVGTPRRTGLRHVFVGDDGVRAGWSLLLFLVFTALSTFALSLALNFVLKTMLHVPRPVKGAPGQAWLTMVNDATGFAALVLSSLVMSRIERRPFASYGLRRVRSVPDVLTGMAWGVAMLSLLIGLLVVCGALAFDRVALGAVPAIGYAFAWLAAFTAVGLFEEYLTRGYLQFTLARGVTGIVRTAVPRSWYARTIGFWVAAFVFSVAIFAGGHLANAGETAMGIVSVALAGITFVYVLYRTGSLWWAIGFHATWDWAQSYLYGVRDSGMTVSGHLFDSHPVGAPLLSGGATGPEGSILVVPTMLLTMLVIRLTLPRRPEAFDWGERPGGSASV